MAKKSYLELVYEVYLEEVKRLAERNVMKLEDALTYEEFCEEVKKSNELFL